MGDRRSMIQGMVSAGLLSTAQGDALEADPVATLQTAASEARVGVRLIQTAPQALAGAETRVPIEWDEAPGFNDGMWVIGEPSRVTIPAGQDGRYVCSMAIGIALLDNGEWMGGGFRLNGIDGDLEGAAVMVSGGQNINPSVPFTDTLELAAGDYVEAMVAHTHLAALDSVPLWSMFTVQKISP